MTVRSLRTFAIASIQNLSSLLPEKSPLRSSRESSSGGSSQIRMLQDITQADKSIDRNATQWNAEKNQDRAAALV
jgi:hypothetical protein